MTGSHSFFRPSQDPDEGLFDDLLAQWFLTRSPGQELNDAISFLTRKLSLTSESTLFDQCCGIGSLSLPLARQGISIIGVDLCPRYIEMAQQESNDLPCRFYQGDATAFVPDRPCDGAINWFSSFGFANENGNEQMLCRILQSLKPGGRLALDFPNVPFLYRHFQKSISHRYPLEEGEAILIREAVIDVSHGLLEQQWLCLLPDGRSLKRESALRLYQPWDLSDMLEECGFVDIEVVGNLNDEPWSLDCQRCICLARRP